MKTCNKTLLIRPLLLGAVFLTLAACSRKETVLDVKTPGGSIEVERDKDTGELDIKIEDQ